MSKPASLALSVLGLLSFLTSARAEQIVDAVTAPSQRLELALPQPGVVREAAVVEGDRVSKGQVLLQQDDAAEQARLRGLKLRADVGIAVRARETDLALKRIIYERKRRLFEQGGGNESEMQEAETDMKLAEIAVERERHEGAVASADAMAQEERVRQMRLLSPIDGFVERIENGVGESTDPQRPSIVVVQIDPLDVEIKGLSSRQVATLKVGQVLQVRYSPNDPWMDAKVKFIAPVVDARSDTQLVKLTMPNPTGRYAGLKVQVRLPDAVSSSAGNDRGSVGVR
jgi:RND family efflux transporter MFP subunit